MEQNTNQEGWRGLDKIVGWVDIVKGVGELALHSLFDSIHREPHPSESEHYVTDAVSSE